MGVQGLWELLTPVGRRVSVDALGSRKLAIDASIWIIQFMKAMRDDKGDMIRNAHLLGFFRRICKLLYLRIKPVFVFDGATPALKRRTVIARRRQREQAQSKIRKTAEKLLLNHLRTRKLEEIASEVNLGSQSKKKINEDVEKTQVDDSTADGKSRSNGQNGLSGPLSSHEKYDQAATDELLAASLAADYGENLENGGESPGGSGEGSDDDDDDGEEQLILPAVKGLDPSVLASLPPSMQLDLLVQMREQLVAENRQKFQKVAKVPSSFSEMQIQAYLKTVAFRREINEVQKAAAGGGIGGVPTARVASTTDREFIFSKTFEGAKPAPNEIEEQRRQEQVMPPPTAPQSKLPASLMKQSSALFSSITGTQEKSVPQEEGVVSLVSTELNKDSDLNSNSVVHTYIDERGHVRVNRRRGMGVRMTRDLQWNLYLMNDVQARNSEEKGISGAGGPPIIPPASIRNTTFPTPIALQSSSVMDKGLQISFVDDGVSELSKDEDGDLFEELVMEGGDSKEDQASVIHGPTLSQSSVGMVNIPAGVVNGVINGEDMEEEEEVDWEDGGVNEESRDGSVVEDRDLAEAVRLSLGGQPAVAIHADELSNQILLEDGPSSDESEVEWEDGTGDVSMEMDFDGAEAALVPSEEAEVEEAIRRSLEDFHPATKPSSQLVIKEPADSNQMRETHKLEQVLKTSPSVRAEAESEEVYLARERTRKGKAVLDGDKEVSLCTTVVRRPYPIISEQDQMAALTLSGMPVIEATTQPPPAMNDKPPNAREKEPEGKIDFRSICIPESTGNSRDVIPDAPSKLQSREEVEATSVQVDQSKLPSRLDLEEEVQATSVVQVDQSKLQRRDDDVAEEVKTTSVKADQKEETSRVEVLEMKPVSLQPDGPPKVTDRETLAGSLQSDKQPKATESEATPPNNLVRQEQAVGHNLIDGVEVSKGPHHPSKLGTYAGVNEEVPLREAEEINAAIERDEIQRREAAALSAEREKLAREEADLQELLETEQADLQAGLDRERELLAQEEMELLAAQRKNERNADSVTGEMFAEVQELLQMFGLPYIIAPMEAEAQCAYMDTIQLVDGVVTDDSDVFLFGGRTVYKNLFDDRKYVETYYMKDLESEMGMSREKLIRIAMLLGSDYTEGISGIGIVNAIEVVNAFPEDDGLQKFKEWLDSPDHALFQKAQGQLKGKGKSSGRGDKTGVDGGLDGDGAGDLDETEDGKFTLVQKSFMHKHRGVSKNWVVPESFPSESVVTAYVSPVVDKSSETFAWGRPDLEALRGFCYERFIWNKEKADELLLPVLKEYDRRETQTRLESFFHFNQRFAKIRSRRIQKAVTGMTGKRSAELMDLPPHLITDPKPKKSRKKREPPKANDEALGNNVTESGTMEGDVDVAVNTPPKRGGRGGRGRPGRQGGKQQSGDLQSTELLAGNVDNGVDVKNVSNRGGRNMSRASGQGRGRGRGRGRGKGKAVSDEEASISDSSDSEDAMEDALGGADSMEGLAATGQPRRSTRQRSQVPTYQVEDSDEEAGGTCSDGEEMFKEVDLLVAEALQNKPKEAAPLNKYIETDITVSNSDMPTEGARLEKTSVLAEGAGPSETSEFATAGGFCPEEEDELGQSGQEMGEPTNALGGGFCLSDDEQNQPHDGGNGNVVEDSPLNQQSPRFGGGFCLSDEDGKEVGQREIGFAQEHIDKYIDNSRSEKVDIESSKEVDQSAVIPDALVSGNVSQGISQSSEPTEIGLRAMPLMRRKKRKKSP